MLKRQWFGIPDWSTAYPVSAASTAARARFTPDDRAIIALTGIGVKIISLETGEVTREIGEYRIYSRRDMDLSPDGQRLVVGTDSGDIWMYDYESGQELWSHKQGYLVNNVQFSPDGSKLLITSLERRGNVPDFLLAEYDAVSGQQLRTYAGHTGTVLSARYNREGTRLVTTGYDSTVRVWSTETGEELARLDFGTYPHWAEFNKGGMRIVVAGEGEGGVWELQPASSVSEPVAGESVGGRLNVQPNPVRGMFAVPFTLPKRVSAKWCHSRASISRIIATWINARLVCGSTS